MNKKIIAGLLAFFLGMGTQVKAIGFLDLCAVCVASSYAYHGWCYWANAQHGKPSTEIIKELRICLAALREKVSKEQRDIEECQKSVTDLRKELDYYKSALGLR